MWTGIIQNTGSIVISHPWDWFPFLWQSCINLCTNLPSSVHRRRRGCRCGRFAALQLLHHRYRSCCSWCTWRALIGNKSCLLALWPGWNVGVAHQLKMAERPEDQEKKTGSDLEFGVPDVQLAITNKIVDPFLHTYLSLSLQLHLSRWTIYLMLWRMYGAGVLWVNMYIPLSHLHWMTYSDGMPLMRLA